MKKILSSLILLVAMACATALGYLIFSRLALPGIVTVMLSAATGTLILLVVFGAVISLLRRSRMNHIQDMHHSLTHTLNEVANGNFNVFIEIDHHAPHNDIAEAINEMVGKLGNMENMRQDFISNVSHEIQSPLTSIGGFAAILKQDDLPPEQRKHYADVIEAESKRLSTLSENLLKLSTLGDNKTPLNKTEFRLDKQLQTVALTLEPQWAEKNINLEADLQKLVITADEDLLSQVWINLLHNAIKFTPEGGTIQLTLDNERLTITDTGVGISPDDQIHIFERFYKVDKARDRSLGGNGLGLAIVKRILDLHGFEISVRSEPGNGTAFTVSFEGTKGH